MVVRHWESLLVAEREEWEGGDSSGNEGDRAQTAGRKKQYQDDGRQWAEEGHQQLMAKAKNFYANFGVVASTDPGWLQLAFDMLTGYLTGWAYRRISERPWGWYSGLAGRLVCGQTRPTP